MDITKIMAYESGDLTSEETVQLFQDLIDTGQAWRLQGHYGRVAHDLLEAGLCTLGEEGHFDSYGNYVPSKHEVVPGTIGSEAYCERKAA